MIRPLLDNFGNDFVLGNCCVPCIVLPCQVSCCPFVYVNFDHKFSPGSFKKTVFLNKNMKGLYCRANQSKVSVALISSAFF